MKIRFWIAACCLSLMGHGAVAQTYLQGATIIDGTGGPTIEDGAIIVDNGQLACVGTRQQCQPPADSVIVDIEGRFVTPGLVDAHVHFGQTGWLDGRPDGISAPDVYPYEKTANDAKANPGRWQQSYLCSGITAVFDVGGPFWTTELREAADNNPKAAHVKAAGPLISWAGREQMQLNDEIYSFLPMGSVEESEAGVAKLKAMGAQAVKVWYLAPPVNQRDAMDQRMLAIGAAAKKAGLPLLVHATSLREAKVALQAGAHMLVHSVSDVSVDQAFLDLLIENNTIYAPTLVVGGGWTRALTSVVFNAPAPIDDPNGCVDQQTVDNINQPNLFKDHLPESLDNQWAYRRLESAGHELALLERNLMAVHAAGATIATATDAGNPMTLHGPSIYAEMEAMQSAGLTPEQIIVMSTKNGAKAMQDQNRFGTLEAGKAADLLVLKQDPREDISAFRTLSYVMRAGVLRKHSELAYRTVNN